MKFFNCTLLLLSLFILDLKAVETADFDPAKEPATGMQYYTPVQAGFFCGDPMPFSHDSTFFVYWLLDHHSSDPLGGHVWTTMTSNDLVHWEHHPIALNLDSPVERSMCTGSVFYHDGIYYAFYATRVADEKLYKREVISVAISSDGIHFEKQQPMVLFESPEGYALTDLRDPFIFEKNGRFYMIVTALSATAEFDHAAPCLIYYESDDLKKWAFKGRFYTPGSAEGFAHSECSDLFKLGNHYYLLFKINGGTHYRMADSPFGPWRATPNDNIGNDYALVFKTAEFKGRRIAVGFIPWRENNRDDGAWQYGGSLVFRELKQQSDGSLGAGFVPEMTPPDSKETVTPTVTTTWGKSEKLNDGRLSVVSDGGFGAIRLSDIPENSRISFRITPDGYYSEAGVLLHDEAQGRNYYDVRFIPKSNKVTLGNTFIDNYQRLTEPFDVEIIMKGSVIDVCINGERCIVNRVFNYHGNHLSFYVRDGKVTVENLKVAKLK